MLNLCVRVRTESCFIILHHTLPYVLAQKGCFSSRGCHPRVEKRILNMASMSMLTFKQAWTQSIWPTVRPQYEELLQQRPSKQGLEEEAALGGHYGKKVLTKCAEKGQCRNISCNLAWTDPTDNTPMQENISYEAVAMWALDTYVDVTAVDVEDDEPKAADDVDTVAASTNDATSTLTRGDLLLENKKKPWLIPTIVPRGFNLPIALGLLRCCEWHLACAEMGHGGKEC